MSVAVKLSSHTKRRTTVFEIFRQSASLFTGGSFPIRPNKHLSFLFVVFALAVLLLPGSAFAGTGTFREGKFNFCVSVRFNATEAQLQRIREVFGVASQILGDATDGQHQFGTISIINNSGASDQADFWIHPSGARANASGRYGMRGSHVNLYYGSEFAQPDTIRNGLVVVHEFAHLAYGLGDEYYSRVVRNPDGNLFEVPAHCPGPDRNSPTLNYCIMDDFTKGARLTSSNYSVNELCVAANHDKPNADGTGAYDTSQSLSHNNDSCWETMSKIQTKWRLALPSGLPQDAPHTTQPVVFNTTCGGQIERVVLLIDRSGSMTTQNRLAYAKTAASHFVSLYGSGNSLGVVSFSTTATVDFPLSPMNDAAKNNARFAVNALSASGSTNIGDGLLLALSQLNSDGCSDCQKTIVLLSDGDANVGLAPESLIQSLQASDVKVVAATVGTDISVAGERSLKTVANQTGGGYFRAIRPIDFFQFLVQLAFGTSGYRGIANAPNSISSNQVREIPILVETGAATTNYGISLGDQTDNITLALRKPSGATITEGNAPAGQFAANAGLKVFKIPAPEPGMWTMVLTTGMVQSGDLQVFAYGQHDGTDFWATIDDDNILSTQAIRVHATPTHDGKNVVGASVTGHVIRPDGSQVSITLFDDGAETHGDASANDGVYSALFDSYSVSGTYTFDLKYQNASGQTYAGEPLPNENGIIETFPTTGVPPVIRITSVTAIVEGISNGDRIWFDDVLPEGATAHADGEGWYWVDANPGAFSGTKSHQSRSFGQAEPPNSFHQHYFDGATTTLPVNAGDKLFTYVFLDINNMPREIMLQWKDASGWEHRAYWGANNIPWGVDGTNSRRYMGPLPRAGTWVRLEVSASLVGLEGATLNGMAFTLDGGRATFDLAGKTNANAPPPPTTPPGDFVWVDDAVPAGSTLETVDDQWQWIEPRVCGTQGHRSFFTVNQGAGSFRSHSFRNASTTMSVNPGDVLFTYVYLDANHMPDQLMLQWHDGTGWEHRAFWGENYIGQKIPNMGVQGTESQRYMGGIPPGNQWVRLEVPASYVGLEGKTVSGMAFGFYSRVDKAGINWDCSGKSSQLTTVPLPLSATSSVWRLHSNTYGWSYNTNDQGEPEHIPQKKDAFFVHPNQAAGTVPMHRFKRPGNNEYFYSQSMSYHGNGWVHDGVAFYVFPDASIPGTVPLYLYHDNRTKYFLTTDQNEATSLGMTFDAIWGYVYSVNPQIPATPTQAVVAGCAVNWRDNSATETGFRIEELNSNTGVWNQIGTAAANHNSFCVAGNLCNQEGLCMATGSYRVQAFNAFGNSKYSNIATYHDPIAEFVKSGSSDDPVNPPPDVNITFPASGDVVDHDFAINANSFDIGGNGTIAKVEFFANAAAAESVEPGLSQEPVNPPPYVNITSPVSGELVDHDFAINANSFDIDGNGTIVKVEFFANGTKLGEVWDAPYVFVWNNAPLGMHSLTAIATDSAGASTTSSPVNVTVNNIAPTVDITSPTDGALFTASSDISISASASDSDGSVSKVEFFQGSTKLGEATLPPYNLVWNSVTSGSYILTAVATDNSWQSTTSSPISVVVNDPPSITITTSDPESVPSPPANIMIYADAYDTDGSITTIELYQGSTLLGTSATSPFNFQWTNVGSGTYTLTANATDDRGVTTTSNAVTVTVNAPPVVTMTSPSANSSYFAPASISLTATASDADGTVTRVDLYQGQTLLRRCFSSSCAFNWANVPVGNYVLTAKAADNSGALSTSASIPVSVKINTLAINKIAFASNRGGKSQIYLMNTDGTGQTRLTNNSANDEAPKWSPDNSKIVFQSDRDYQPTSDEGAVIPAEIYTMKWDGTQQVRLTNNVYDDSAPVWSPDGAKIAFQSARNGVNYQIYVMNADGSGQVNMSNSTSNDTQPSWSPDGTRIAFASDRDQPGFPSIYVMNASGAGQARLTSSDVGFRDEQPAWSPDGTKLSFTSTRDSVVVTWVETDDDGAVLTRTAVRINKEIYVMNADGGAQLRLTNTLENDDSPAWSGDGTKIVFRSDRERECCDPSAQIWLMNTDGSNQVNLSNNQFGDHCPGWAR